MKGSPIALLTDFGTRDPYVPAMKGAIYSEYPAAVITDVSHEIRRHDIESAAYHLLCVHPHFPRGTIFVCVVDPGVGSARRILILKNHGHLFLAPDNGILNYLCSSDNPGKAFALLYGDDAKGVSRTFHGRDIFAPTAARLARGKSISSTTSPVRTLVSRRLYIEVPSRSNKVIRGRVLHIDNFGNVITNLKLSRLNSGQDVLTMGRRINREVADTYSTGPVKKSFMIIGSTELVEVSIKNGDAARSLRVRVGDRVSFRRTQPS